MSKVLKAMIREELKSRFAQVDGGVFISSQGLNSEKTYSFRSALQARNVKFSVIRNAFTRQAFIEHGYPQREIAESAYQFQRQVEAGERKIVGVNSFTDETQTGVSTLYLDEGIAEGQCAALDRLRETRNTAEVESTLNRLRDAALGSDNLMPILLDAVRAYATIGEMCDALRDVWGEYEEAASV